jgi:hypothetical protein
MLSLSQALQGIKIDATFRLWGIYVFHKAHCENWMPTYKAKEELWCALQLHYKNSERLPVFQKDLPYTICSVNLGQFAAGRWHRTLQPL